MADTRADNVQVTATARRLAVKLLKVANFYTTIESLESSHPSAHTHILHFFHMPGHLSQGFSFCGHDCQRNFAPSLDSQQSVYIGRKT